MNTISSSWGNVVSFWGVSGVRIGRRTRGRKDDILEVFVSLCEDLEGVEGYALEVRSPRYRIMESLEEW